MRDAVSASLFAPSILNTQPWHWRLRDACLELSRDPDRRLAAIDPTGRMVMVSCGTALHHARVILQARGYAVEVRRLPAGSAAEPLAVVEPTGPAPVAPPDVEMAAAIRHRRSDRRPIAATSRVDDGTIAALDDAAAREGCALFRIGDTERPYLGAAVAEAQRTEGSDPAYRRDLAAWTVRRPPGGGVSFESLVAAVARPVAVRDFAGDGETGLFAGFGDDRFADYLIVGTPADTGLDQLRAGEATSAVWLTATARDLAMSVMSDVVEVPATRASLDGLLAGRARPQLVLRTGIQGQPVPPPPASHRELRDVLDE
ncbi:NAD(P)H nitroreductase [Asanoa iriomotensis]|uniref:NAD(P)H nitroreductase n=1 Tax=Asanoa iriomotensis TaxID=234613 RepID=A0ABQ4CDX2_9ACTN|nr:NAD(P)H nitroreductase [Asanoa iriomotensis]